MPSLKAIRKRIASVKNTQKITKAMKMVAAARLRRAQDAVQSLRPYANHLGQLAHDLASHLSEEPEADAVAAAPADAQPEAETAKDEAAAAGAKVPTPEQLRRILIGKSERRVRLVVVSSDRGLAGAYNSNVFRRTERQVTEIKLEDGREVELLILGRKGRDFFRRRPHKIVGELGGVDPKTASARAAELAQSLTRALFNDECDAVYVVFNEFKTAASVNVKVRRLLPVEVAAGAAQGAKKGGPKDEAALDEPKTLVDFLYEPDRDAVLAHLVPLYLTTELQRIFLEAIASELGARMSAMDSASRNAKEMISRLTLQYNRARQALITKELMEIIGGAEALKG
ncbi:MAG: ATP synthase F1 subunit gamma [Polyangia bacterium]